MNPTSRGPQPRVSGRVDPSPRPDTATPADYITVFIILGGLLFIPAWITTLI